VIIFDTEYTAWCGSMECGWSRPGEYKEIIQIGAIKINSKLQVEDTFDVLVKPVLNPILSDYIQRLTKIDQGILESQGVDLLIALKSFKTFCEGSDVIISNGGDQYIIEENLKIRGQSLILHDLTFCDIQPIFAEMRGDRSHISIEEMASILKISGRHHSALSDSFTLHKILEKSGKAHNYNQFVKSLLAKKYKL